MQRALRRYHRYFYFQGDGLAYEATILSMAKRVGRLPPSAAAVPDGYPRWTGGPLGIEDIVGLRAADSPLPREEGEDAPPLPECEEVARDDAGVAGDAGEGGREPGGEGRDGDAGPSEASAYDGRGAAGGEGGGGSGSGPRLGETQLLAQAETFVETDATCDRELLGDLRQKGLEQARRLDWLWDDLVPQWWWPARVTHRLRKRPGLALPMGVARRRRQE